MADRSYTYEFRGKFDSLRAGLAASGRSVEDFGQKLVALDKNGAKMRQGLTHFGDLGGKIALGAAAGLTAIVAVTANFDKAMSNVAATGDDARQSLDALREAAIAAGADTAFSASEAASGIENLLKAGVSSKDVLGGGLKGALDLAAAGELGVADAAEIAATAMTQFKLSGADVPHIADLLAAGAGKAQGEVSDMAAALAQSGLVASQFGISIEDTTGTLAAFASQGLLGSDAGTSFKTMLLALAKPSEKSAKLMRELGINAYDAQGQFVGLKDLAEQLTVAFEGKTDAERQSALATIFGTDAIRAASALYDEGADGIQQWVDKTNDAGYAAETAGTKLDNLSGDIEALQGSLETALIGAGEGSQGPLRKTVQTLTDVVNAFNDLPPAAQSTVTAFLGVTAVLGGGLWFTAKTVQGIANTREALANLGWTADRTGGSLKRMALTSGRLFAVAGAVTAIGAAIAAATDDNLDLSDLGRDLESIAAGGGEAQGTIDQIVKSVGLVGQLEDPLQSTGEALRDTLGTIVTFGQADKTGIDRAQDDLAALDETLAQMVESGHAEEAFQVIDRLLFAIGQSGGDSRVLLDSLDSFDTAMENYRASAADGADAAEDLAGATDDAGQAASRARPQFEEMSKAMRDARKDARGTAQEFFNLGPKVDKAKVSLQGWIKSLEKQAAALRDFRENAQKAAKQGLDDGLIASLEAAGPAGALRMKQLANATDAEIKRANKAWQAGQREVEKYVNYVGGVPKRVSTDVNVNGATDATRQVNGLVSALSNVRDKTAYIKTVFERHNITVSEHDADGGTVGGQRQPYGDRVIAALAPGEEVVSNRYGQADRNRSLLKAINANRFADGGTVPAISDYMRSQSETRSGDNEASRQARETGKALKGLTARLHEAQKAVEAEKNERDALLDKMKSVSGSVAGGLRSDLFGDTNPWATGSIFDSALGGLRTDLGNAKQMRAAIRTLKAKGLTGPALAYVLSEGGLAGALAFAQESGAELKEFTQLFNRRNREAKEIGQLAGRASFGAAFAAERKELQEANRRLDAIEKALHKANRDRKEEHKKDRDATKRGASNAQRSRRPD